MHKVTFIVWLVFTAIHVLAHLPNLGHSLAAVRTGAERAGRSLTAESSGSLGRWLALGGVVLGRVVLAVALLPRFGSWTAPGAFAHHHHAG